MGPLFAVFVISIGFAETYIGCPGSCLARVEDQSRFSIQAAGVNFKGDWLGSEVVAGYDFDRRFGAFQPTIAVSFSDQGDVWAGYGAKWRTDLGQSDFFIESSFLPGVYLRGVGPDLGGSLQFRSTFGVGYEFANEATFLVSIDHRSNADLHPLNPGLETLSFQYSIALD